MWSKLQQPKETRRNPAINCKIRSNYSTIKEQLRNRKAVINSKCRAIRGGVTCNTEVWNHKNSPGKFVALKSRSHGWDEMTLYFLYSSFSALFFGVWEWRTLFRFSRDVVEEENLLIKRQLTFEEIILNLAPSSLS